jgi:hypothetical protein
MLATLAAATPSFAARTPAAPIVGSLSCGLTGTMTFNKAIPNANLDGSVRAINVKLSAAIGSCSNHGVTGGAAPITGGTLVVQGKLDAGASCGDLAFGPPDITFESNKMQAKWTSTTLTGKHPTVGKSKTDIYNTNTTFGDWEYDSDNFGGTDAFANESAVIDLQIDNAAAVKACALGENGPDGHPVNLASVQFTAAHGSTIVVSNG